MKQAETYDVPHCSNTAAISVDVLGHLEAHVADISKDMRNLLKTEIQTLNRLDKLVSNEQSKCK